jgi:hypothetical protein
MTGAVAYNGTSFGNPQSQKVLSGIVHAGRLIPIFNSSLGCVCWVLKVLQHPTHPSKCRISYSAVTVTYSVDPFVVVTDSCIALCPLLSATYLELRNALVCEVHMSQSYNGKRQIGQP